jgi:hypothetical protein
MTDPEIKKLLETMADEVAGARPLERTALRRTRTRRLALALTTVVSVLSVAVAGTGLALSGGFGGGSSTVPATSDSTPPPPNAMPGTIVAHGYTDDGHEWWLSAERSATGELCTYLQHDTGDTFHDCRPYTGPDDVGFEEDEVRDGVFGWVHEDSEKLWVTWPSEYEDDPTPEDEPADEDEEETQDEQGPPEGEAPNEQGDGNETHMTVTIEGEEPVELFDAPEGFPFPVRFYALIPAPSDPEALHIRLRSGDSTVIFVSRPERGPNVDVGAEASGSRLVADGEHDGYPWKLYERTNAHGSRCIDLRWNAQEFGSAEGCSTAVPDDESFQYTMAGFPGGAVAFFAALSQEVATLELTLKSGDIVEAEILEGPRGSDVNYAVVWPPLQTDGPFAGTVRGTATSRDADGEILDTMTLCPTGIQSVATMVCSSDSRP